jgi:SOS-response transcriptional repressor LexA
MKKKLIVSVLGLSCVALKVVYGEPVSGHNAPKPLTCLSVFSFGYISIRMKDDSMSPLIEEGDVVIASRTEAFRDNFIHIVRLKQGNEKIICYARRENDGLTLTPENKKYESRFVKHDEVAEVTIVLQANSDREGK